MKKNKLNKYIIVSVAFHVVLISAVLLYFLMNPISGGKSGTVMVGVIGTQQSGQSSSGPEGINKSGAQNEVSKPKIALDKQQPKENIKKQRTTKKEIEKESTKKDIKQAAQSKQISPASVSKNNSAQSTGIESASIAHTSNSTDNGHGTQGLDNTLAYPDYNHNPKPKYPRAARKRGFEGEVKLNVYVLPDGKVGKIELLRPSGHKILDDEAIEAVKNWIFIPGKQDGKEISSWVTVPITFQLKNG